MATDNIAHMNYDEIQHYLKDKFQFSDEVSLKFRYKEIDGEAYFGLTESILSTLMRLKSGQIIKILKDVNSLASTIMSALQSTAESVTDD